MAVIAIAAIRFMMPPLPAAASNEQPAFALRTFWAGVTSGPDAPLVVYSNAEFVGRPETGIRYFNPALDDGKKILDHYTGVGEVMAIHDLDAVFGSLQRPVRIKRGRTRRFWWIICWPRPAI